MERQELLDLIIGRSIDIGGFELLAKAYWRSPHYDTVTSQIKEGEIQGIIKNMALGEAAKFLPYVISRREEPEHCLVNDWTIAYAIQQGRIPMEEARRITFETPNGLEEFLKQDTEKIIAKLARGIVEIGKKETPTSTPEITCCDGGPCTC
ncbi:hypothetical protein KA107_00670 [Candidatus Pacearchaeota archaeon]|nr:hypothetical protein [Candidatus Pacearchaeota archaeon]